MRRINHRVKMTSEDKWRLEHKEQIEKRRKEYYMENRDKYREYMKRYNKEYYEKNKKKELEYLKKYRNTPKGKEILKRAIENFKIFHRNYNNERRLKFIELLGGKCCKCGFSDYRALEIHHINGKKHRGKEVWSYKKLKNNEYILLCANCHRIIHSNS